MRQATGVQVAGERLAADAQRFQRNRASAGERVHYQGRLLRISGANQPAGDLQVRRVGGVVPVGKAADELQKLLPEGGVAVVQGPHCLGQKCARL